MQPIAKATAPLWAGTDCDSSARKVCRADRTAEFADKQPSAAVAGNSSWRHHSKAQQVTLRGSPPPAMWSYAATTRYSAPSVCSPADAVHQLVAAAVGEVAQLASPGTRAAAAALLHVGSLLAD